MPDRSHALQLPRNSKPAAHSPALPSAAESRPKSGLPVLIDPVDENDQVVEIAIAVADMRAKQRPGIETERL